MLDAGAASSDPEPVAKRRAAVIGRALGWSVCSSAGILLVNIGTGVLLARELGPELRGAVAAAILIPSLAVPLGVLGLAESLNFFVARLKGTNGELLGSAMAMTLGLSVITTGISVPLVRIVLASRYSEHLSSAYFFLGSVPLGMVTIVLVGYINGCHRFAWVQTLRASFVVIAGIGLFVAAWARHLDVRTAMLVYFAANCFTMALAGVMAKRLLHEPLRANLATARDLLAFGLRSSASTLAWQLNHRIDQPIIAALLAPAQLGLYVTAVTISSLALLVGSSVIYVGLPVMASLEDADERRRLACVLISVTLIASALLTLPLFAGVEMLLDLFFGPEFAIVAPVARILLVASTVLSVNRAIESVLIGIGRPSDAAKAEILTLPVTAIGLIVLLPLIGIAGAGWTSLVAYLTAFVLSSGRAATALGTTRRRLLVPSRNDFEALILRWRAFRHGAQGGSDRTTLGPLH